MDALRRHDQVAVTLDLHPVSGPRKDGADKLYGGLVEIDEDARIAYWTEIRTLPANVGKTSYRAGASTRTGGQTRQV